MPRALVVLRASRGPNRRVFRRSQILALGTAYLLIYRLGSSSATASALALRNSAALTSTSYSTVVLHYPSRACDGPRPDGSVPATFRRDRPTLRFSRDILVPTTGVCESCSLSGALPSSGSCAPRPEQLQVYRSSNFCASSSHSVTWRTDLTPMSAMISTRKPLGHLPSPEDGPRTPTGQSLASENAPFGAVPAGRASLIEVSNHRWTFAALLRVAAQGSNTTG